MSKILENLLYTDEHEWISIEGDVATVGITDFAQSSLGEIVFVELPQTGTNYDKGDSFGVVESIKSVSDLYIPVAGQVIETNSAIEESPETINQEPYTAWLIKIKVSDSSQVESLLDAKKYQEFCESN